MMCFLIAGITMNLVSEEVRLTSGNSITGSVLKESKKYVVVLSDRGIETVKKENVAEIIDDPVDFEVAIADPSKTTGDVEVPQIPQPGDGDNNTSSNSSKKKKNLSNAKKVALVITGSFNKKKIDSSHEQTRAHVGYFLLQEAAVPFALVENDKKAIADADVKIVIDTVTKDGKPLDFMGAKIFSRAVSNVKFELHKKVGGRFRKTDNFSLQEAVTGHEDRMAALLDEAYAGAMTKVVARMKSMAYFNGKDSKK